MYIIPVRRGRYGIRFFLISPVVGLLLGGILVAAQGSFPDWRIDRAMAIDGDGGPTASPTPSGSPSPDPTPSAQPSGDPPLPIGDPTAPPPPPPQPPPSAAGAIQTFPPLPPTSGEGRRIVYGNSYQRIWLVESDGTVFASWLVSGRKGLPRPGTYRVASKSRYSSARGGRIRFEYMVRYAKGRRLWMGFHSIPVSRRGPIQSEARLGTFTSTGGCVRQRRADAETLYEWAPVGAKVVVTP